MKKFSLIASTLCLAILSTSCSSDRYHVEGTIAESTDSILYFENLSLNGPETIDSLKLSRDGKFAFSGERPEAPEFFRLRIGTQIINISIDSTETVTVNAKYPTMATNYDVLGSDNCERIKQLSLMQIGLEQAAIALEKNIELSRDEVIDSLNRMLKAYKTQVTRNFIYKDPRASSSYFALFQTLGDWLIFNPRADVTDIRTFAAVATAWDSYHAGSLRAQNLHNIAIEEMKNKRIVESNNSRTIDASKISTSGIIDIVLEDNNGNIRKLSELKGKVVLLDFHLFAMEESPSRILMLRELYNKYHSQGLEIFQVSLDDDEHFWKQQTKALPWISVRDADGLQTRYIRSYNIKSVPEYFLIDKSNSLVSRSSQVKNVDDAIRRLL
jgi:peroxiredoxin